MQAVVRVWETHSEKTECLTAVSTASRSVSLSLLYILGSFDKSTWVASHSVLLYPSAPVARFLMTFLTLVLTIALQKQSLISLFVAGVLATKL